MNLDTTLAQIQHSPSFNICAMLCNICSSVYCFPYQCCVNKHCVVFGWGGGWAGHVTIITSPYYIFLVFVFVFVFV